MTILVFESFILHLVRESFFLLQQKNHKKNAISPLLPSITKIIDYRLAPPNHFPCLFYTTIADARITNGMVRNIENNGLSCDREQEFSISGIDKFLVACSRRREGDFDEAPTISLYSCILARVLLHTDARAKLKCYVTYLITYPGAYNLKYFYCKKPQYSFFSLQLSLHKDIRSQLQNN